MGEGIKDLKPDTDERPTSTDALHQYDPQHVADGGEAAPKRRGRGGGGAAARRAKRGGNTPITAMPAIERRVPVYEPLSDANIVAIEQAADRLLEEVGIEFRDDEEALAMWREAGASVDGERVRFPRGLCRSLLSTAPETFVQHARNPERSVTIGGNSTVFAPVYGPPFVRALDGERRYGTMEDFENIVRLAYMAPSLHHSGGTVCEPTDVPVNKRHLDMVLAHMTLSDKPFMGSVTAPERAKDTVEMCRILFGEEFVDQNCVVVNLINANSPMVFDGTMLGALKVYARANQGCVVSPFILAGAMSPVTVAGTLTQVLAEVLAGAAFTQLCRPGAPVVFGTFAASISMQSGAPTFGTPEPNLVSYGAAQLARRLKLPFRTGGGLCGSKLPDAQAANESQATLQTTLLAGTNFVLHAAGWLEGGLVASFAKLMIDADQLGMLQRFAQGVSTDDDSLATAAFAEVPPGEHFLGCDHTRSQFETAFYRSDLTDNNSFEQWEIEGGKRIEERATERAKAWLDSYVQPPLDPNVAQRLKEFVDAKKASMPDAFT